MASTRNLDRDIPRYGALDYHAIWAEFPPAPDYVDGVFRASRDELTALQRSRFQREMARAWQVPFYRRFWGAAGMEPGDIGSLDDLPHIPTFSVHDLRDASGANPPWGDLIGIDPETHDPVPLMLQTSGGTTGMPRAMLYTARDREIMNIMTGRRMYLQGVRPFDLVQVALATGLQNAGPLLRESLIGYTGAVPIMTGTGSQTPTRRQVEILKEWKVDWFAVGGAYARHVAKVAREELGIDVADLKLKGLLSWLGSEPREPLEELWGTDVFDNYGTNEFGTIAADCRAKAGMHLFEDAFIAEILDGTTGGRRPEGERGSLVLTTLFKHAAPMIRFNTNDVFHVIAGTCPCGGTHRRLSAMQGRADNMVKFRGTSIFPDAIGALLAQDRRTTGEYVCVLEPPDQDGRERLKVMVEAANDEIDRGELARSVAARLKEGVGVTLDLEIVGSGALRLLTLVDSQTKVRRLIDKRKE